MKNRGNSLILKKLASNTNYQIDQREYRLLTGSDDGYVFFWNIPYDLISEAKNNHSNLLAIPNSIVRKNS